MDEKEQPKSHMKNRGKGYKLPHLIGKTPEELGLDTKPQTKKSRYYYGQRVGQF